jgi:hypothetical protein
MGCDVSTLLHAANIEGQTPRHRSRVTRRALNQPGLGRICIEVPKIGLHDSKSTSAPGRRWVALHGALSRRLGELEVAQGHAELEHTIPFVSAQPRFTMTKVLRAGWKMPITDWLCGER